MTTSQFILTSWRPNPLVFLFSAAACTWYLGSFILKKYSGWFFMGIAVLILTLTSPLNALADGYLFSAHMAQHILLLLVVPALLLLGMPPRSSSVKKPRATVNRAVGWASGMGAMWFWHVPSICNAAVASPWVHSAQTVSLLMAGGLFWWPILSPCHEQRLNPLAAVLYLGSACMACSVLGIIITLSPVAVCSMYAMPPSGHPEISRLVRTEWNISFEKDQQIGGLLMWLPMCLVYLAAIMAQLARWFAVPLTGQKKQI